MLLCLGSGALLGCGGYTGYAPEPDLFTIAAPEGQGWSLRARNRNGVMYGKILSQTHSAVAVASATRIDKEFGSAEDFVAWVKSERAKGRDNDRPRCVPLEFTEEQDDAYGPYCVRFYLKSEDHGATTGKSLPGGTHLISVMRGYTFITNGRPGMIFNTFYSERYLPGEGAGGAIEEGEEFIGSLTLAPDDSEP
jgi:hypothetical protein